MNNPAQSWRRWFGVLFLILAAGMLIWGETLLSATLRERPRAFVMYWIGCVALTGLAVLMALLDVRAVRRASQEEQTELLRAALEEIEGERKRREEGNEEGERK